MLVADAILDEWTNPEPPDDPEPPGAGGVIAARLKFVGPPDRPPAEPAREAA